VPVDIGDAVGEAMDIFECDVFAVDGAAHDAAS
jgi:hypothetical protein